MPRKQPVYLRLCRPNLSCRIASNRLLSKHTLGEQGEWSGCIWDLGDRTPECRDLYRQPCSVSISSSVPSHLDSSEYSPTPLQYSSQTSTQCLPSCPHSTSFGTPSLPSYPATPNLTRSRLKTISSSTWKTLRSITRPASYHPSTPFPHSPKSLTSGSPRSPVPATA